MVNRELIRLKALQLIYAFHKNEGKSISAMEKELFFSMSKAYDLYMTLLALMVSLHTEAKRRLEILEETKIDDITRDTISLKAELTKFIQNKFITQLSRDPQLLTFLDNESNRWDNDIQFVRRLFNQIIQSKTYQKYAKQHTTRGFRYDEDREFWRQIYKLFIEQNEEIDALLEEKSIYWNDDKEIVDTFVLKTIKRFERGSVSGTQLLQNDINEETHDFAKRLIHDTLEHSDEYRTYINEACQNWDIERLAYMDIIIMQMAISEMLTFPSIPVNVTINVYIELAKIYSTVNSSTFINGILDAIARRLIEERRMLKAMNRPRQNEL